MGEPSSLPGLLDGTPLTVTGADVAANVGATRSADVNVIRAPSAPLKEAAGFKVIRGNLFDSALMKTSVISDEFRRRFLEGSTPAASRRAPSSSKDPKTITTASTTRVSDRRGDDPLHPLRRPRRLPGRRRGGEHAAAFDALLAKGVTHLPTVGDGRQSGTSESPSILNASPEAAVGGGLAILQTGDRVVLDVNAGSLDLVADDAELARRWAAHTPPEFVNQTPWQELYRSTVGQLCQGGCMELATKYRRWRGRCRGITIELRCCTPSTFMHTSPTDPPTLVG